MGEEVKAEFRTASASTAWYRPHAATAARPATAPTLSGCWGTQRMPHVGILTPCASRHKLVYDYKMRCAYLNSYLTMAAALLAGGLHTLPSRADIAPDSHSPAHVAADQPFATGSLIIPMDTTYQDFGMLKAFGLLDKLLRAGVPISWCIKTPKAVGDTDFVASATDFKTGAPVTNHGYRGGPFVIAAADAPAASPIVVAWQAVTNTTTVHVATATFTAPVSLLLTAAPKLAVLDDGNSSIAFRYLNAAGIPDEANLAWGSASIDLLTPTQVIGPSATNPTDGALFRPSGQPAFCNLISSHWSYLSADVPAATLEMESFLQFPVHLFAECQSVIAIEGTPPAGGRERFLTSMGYSIAIAAPPAAVQYSNSALPFAQMDGSFAAVGGSEPAYALAAGSNYYDSGGVMVRASGQPVGGQDVWITGYARGTCPISNIGNCSSAGPKGKVSYLGGHQYATATPVSTHPTTGGARLFLNSLFAGSCAYAEGQPLISISKSAPATASSATVTFTLSYSNNGPGPALGVALIDNLPAGASFVSASGGGVNTAGQVKWQLGDLVAGASGSVTLTVSLSSYGTYGNQASVTFTIGLTPKSVLSNVTQTLYAASPGSVPDGSGVPGTPLKLVKSSNLIRLDWGASCSASATDYGIYEGTMGSYYSHAAKVCTTGGLTNQSLTPGVGSTYYLVVPLTASYEGSYGKNSAGIELPAGAAACHPQFLQPCP